jgi:hypothetical protein
VDCDCQLQSKDGLNVARQVSSLDNVMKNHGEVDVDDKDSGTSGAAGCQGAIIQDCPTIECTGPELEPTPKFWVSLITFLVKEKEPVWMRPFMGQKHSAKWDGV